jgi:hypothetical protein
MAKGLRLTETWMERALWLVALVFAGFLIGLGGKVVEGLWQVEPVPSLASYIDARQAGAVAEALRQAGARRKAAADALAQAEQAHKVAAANSASGQQSLQNWLAARSATQRPEQDPELLARTRAVDALKAAERAALAAVQAQEQAGLDAEQAYERAASEDNRLTSAALRAREVAGQAHETRVFLYRLAVTLPLLLVAAWLYTKKRKSSYWPFVWGFILFALFAFFVELVPYMPSYGGYVRYIVGIIVTVLTGRHAIKSLQAYLARQQLAEAMPEVTRRATLGYDTAMARVAKCICPGCERGVDLKDGKTDFCPHCGIGLFGQCGNCSARKNAFARYCYACGTAARADQPPG